MVLKQMEEAGKTTSYSRNRKRQRRNFFSIDNSSAPDLGFACCGVMPCGDDYESDNIAFLEHQRRRYREKIRARKEREEFVSQSYLEKKGIKPKMKKLGETKFKDQPLL